MLCQNKAEQFLFKARDNDPVKYYLLHGVFYIKQHIKYNHAYEMTVKLYIIVTLLSNTLYKMINLARMYGFKYYDF